MLLFSFGLTQGEDLCNLSFYFILPLDFAHSFAVIPNVRPICGEGCSFKLSWHLALGSCCLFLLFLFLSGGHDSEVG